MKWKKSKNDKYLDYLRGKVMKRNATEKRGIKNAEKYIRKQKKRERKKIIN